MVVAHSQNDRHYHPPSRVESFTIAELLEKSGRTLEDEQRGMFEGNAGDGSITIYCAGDISLLRDKCVAVVGTRKVSAAGAARARRIGRELAISGVNVVSGLAMGVDTEALQAALKARGRLIGVIGTPVNKVTPVNNGPLQETIYQEHLLLSQFKIGSAVYPGNFPQRNRVMASVSDATVIIEAGDSSGTLHQAAECRRLGRWLFIARSQVEDSSLAWPKRFLEYKRTVVLDSVQDILDRI